MTQASRPQAEHIMNYPFPSDPGPYSADQWSQYMRLVYTGDRQSAQGPLVDVDNNLEVTTNGTTEVYVDTGAGFVNGHLLISDEKETFTIPAGPIAGRTDRVVMVENNSNAEVTQTLAGRPLLFPNDLSEYTATPGVPAYSARLAIVRGVDGGGLPAINYTTALYMVELARYDIDNAPAITNFADYRNWALTPTASVQRLGEFIVLTPTNSVTIANIPDCFTNLRIIGQARTARDDAGLVDEVYMRFNGDAGANYDWVYFLAEGGNVQTSSSGLGANQIWIANVACVDAPANYADQFTINIANYRRTTFYKTATAEGQQVSDYNAARVGITKHCGWWQNTAAIVSIELRTATGANFLAGSVFSLYGLT
jgi:hypothetical protein